MFNLFILSTLVTVVLGVISPRDFQFDSKPRVPNTGGPQDIPQIAKTPGSFSNGNPPLLGEPPDTACEVPDVYGARDIDIPIGRLFHGHLNFFPTLNDAEKDTSVWGSDHDDANQTACGIPANAYFISGVAIHPYFLKYAGLDRYCMQDVCVWFWKDDGSSDMLLKVTDICSDDSADGVPCMTPEDIKIDRTKASIIMNNGKSIPQGNQYPDKVWWLFTKCSADGLIQPAYQNNSNWFSDPYLPNNDKWVQDTAYTQMLNNQKSYPAMGWETYPNGLYNITREENPVRDWDPEKVPLWTPIAGGKGSSLKTANAGGSSVKQARPSSASSSYSSMKWQNTTTSAAGTAKAVSSTKATYQTQAPESDARTTVEVKTLVVVPLQSPESSVYGYHSSQASSASGKAVMGSMSSPAAMPVSTKYVYVCGTTTLH